MGKLGDIAIVNVLFLICSLPILTMGASTAAMYRTFRRMQEGEGGSAFREFFLAFGQALRKSFPAWLFQILTGAVLVFDLMFVVKAGGTVFWHAVGMALGCLLLLWAMVSCYLLPAAVYEGRTLGAALAGSLFLATGNFPWTIAMALLRGIPAACLVLGSYFIGLATPIYLTVGFGATAYLNTCILRKCKGNGGKAEEQEGKLDE